MPGILIMNLTFFLILILGATKINAREFYFHSYTHSDSVLRMVLVTPTARGQLVLKKGNERYFLPIFSWEDIFVISVIVPCHLLHPGMELIWIPYENRRELRTVIPTIDCESNVNSSLVRVVVAHGKCWIDTGGNSLWRTAFELSKINNDDIYTNMYAIFIANKKAFVDNNIHKLRDKVLRCPENAMMNMIEPAHAKRLFQESLISKQK